MAHSRVCIKMEREGEREINARKLVTLCHGKATETSVQTGLLASHVCLNGQHDAPTAAAADIEHLHRAIDIQHGASHRLPRHAMHPTLDRPRNAVSAADAVSIRPRRVNT